MRSDQQPIPQHLYHDLLIINGDAFQISHSGSVCLDLEDDTRVFFRDISDLEFTIDQGDISVRETIEGRDLADYALVQIASYPRPTATLLNSITAYLEHRNRPLVNAAPISAPTKLFQLLKFSQNGLAVPATRYMSRKLIGTSFGRLADDLGLPFVMKAMNASGGRLNFLIESEVDFLHYIHDPLYSGVAFLVQQFVPNNGTFRLLILNGQAAIIMHRCSTTGSHLTNTEQGGHATLFDVDTFDRDALRMATRAADILGCDVAGVNIVQDRHNGQWYLLEANPNPAIGTGAFADEKRRAYSAYLRAKLAAGHPRSTPGRHHRAVSSDQTDHA
ncbi:hypothetical protein AB0911_38365 [Streptomyces nigra]|uniref:ATP-grasp domain-containing protein n=1 Tax=Streptomyces nigra TaxID=1827580 RepID=UPI0034568609